MIIQSLITTVLLVLSIALIAVGVNTGDIIFAIIGGICSGIYNSCIITTNKTMEE